TVYDGNLDFTVENTRLKALDSVVRVSAAESFFPLIQISANGFVFPSNKAYNFYLSYHIYREDDGLEYTWDGVRSAFETDIKNNYEQRIKVVAPEERGDYILHIDIIKEGE